MKERAGVHAVLKGEKVGDEGQLAGDCRFETSNFRDKKGRKRIDKSVFSASAGVLSV